MTAGKPTKKSWISRAGPGEIQRDWGKASMKRLKEGQKLRTPGRDIQRFRGGLLRQIQSTEKKLSTPVPRRGYSLRIWSFLCWHNRILKGERTKSRQGEGLRNVSEGSKIQVDIGTVPSWGRRWVLVAREMAGLENKSAVRKCAWSGDFLLRLSMEEE